MNQTFIQGKKQKPISGSDLFQSSRLSCTCPGSPCDHSCPASCHGTGLRSDVLCLDSFLIGDLDQLLSRFFLFSFLSLLSRSDPELLLSRCLCFFFLLFLSLLLLLLLSASLLFSPFSDFSFLPGEVT